MSKDFTNLLAEFANPIRLEILNVLHDNPSTFTDLSHKFELSNSEVSRHITRLVETDFIEKVKGTKKYQLSIFGDIILSLYQPLEFVFRNLDYFKTHLITDLPPFLMKEIDLLANADFISTTGKVMLKIEEIVNATEDSHLIMTEEPFPFGKEGLDVKYIVPKRMIALKSHVEKINRSSDGRYYNKISISVLISDNIEGLLFFPDLSGNSDFSQCFYVNGRNNKPSIDFLLRIWDYYWENGEKT